MVKKERDEKNENVKEGKKKIKEIYLHLVAAKIVSKLHEGRYKRIAYKFVTMTLHVPA